MMMHHVHLQQKIHQLRNICLSSSSNHNIYILTIFILLNGAAFNSWWGDKHIYKIFIAMIAHASASARAWCWFVIS